MLIWLSALSSLPSGCYPNKKGFYSRMLGFDKMVTLWLIHIDWLICSTLSCWLVTANKEESYEIRSASILSYSLSSQPFEASGHYGYSSERCSIAANYPVDFCLFPVDCCLFPVDFCLFPVDFCLFPVDFCLFPVDFCLFPDDFCLFPVKGFFFFSPPIFLSFPCDFCLFPIAV